MLILHSMHKGGVLLMAAGLFPSFFLHPAPLRRAALFFIIKSVEIARSATQCKRAAGRPGKARRPKKGGNEKCLTVIPQGYEKHTGAV